MTEIVCMSSVCLDDTMPANGWNLTDIHLRTYSEKNTFQRAIARCTTPGAEAKMTRKTALHSSFTKHTSNLTEYKGFWMLQEFAKEGVIEEYCA